MLTPAADILVDDALVRAILKEQHPDLADLPLRLVANGWDNAIYRLGDAYVVRVPRRAVAANLIANENRWLPFLSSRIQVAIPVPVRVGEPSPAFAWPWSITRWIDGVLAAETPFEQHGSLAPDLARFVRELHAEAPATAPANPVRGVPLSARAKVMVERLASGLVPRAGEVERAWQRALTTPPWAGPPLWLHGDLHPANILTRDGELAAVIDFGDLTAGDPATDLATAWLTFDASGRAAFIDQLDYDDDTWSRARGWALVMGSALVTASSDAPTMRRIGEHALAQVLDDPIGGA